VSAAEFFENFEDVTRKEGNWSKLMVEQIEYANTVVLNKVDLCNEEQLTKIENHLALFNPTATILRARNSVIDVSKVVHTGLYNPSQLKMFNHTVVDLGALPTCCTASIGRGESPCCRRARTFETEKSQVLLGSSKLPKTRHEARFGIRSFIYKARRPFHPERFNKNFLAPFFMFALSGEGVEDEDEGEEDQGEEDEDGEADEDEEEDDGEDEGEGGGQKQQSSDFVTAFNKLEKVRSQFGQHSPEYQMAANSADDQVYDAVEADSRARLKKQAKAVAKARREEAVREHQKSAKAKQLHRTATIGGVLRSKGYIWATHTHDFKTVYQQSCNTVTIDVEAGQWDVLNKKAWVVDQKKGHGHGHGMKSEHDIFREDFVEPWGDRRQEIVFIGNDMKHDVVQQILDDCQLTDAEYAIGVDGWKALWGNLGSA